MLKLFVTLKDHYLRVREALPNEEQENPFNWKNELLIQYTIHHDYMMAWTSLLPDLEPIKARGLVELVGARYPVSAEYGELKKLCPSLIFEDGASEWIFYGGSFNPWHSGHQTCINLLPEDKTCFIVPDINPQKEPSQFELVSRVLEISSKSRLRPHQFLVPTFLIQNTKNPTIDWVLRLKKYDPHKKISLLLGFDSFEQIPTWIRAEELLNLLSGLYVASRLENEQMRKEAETKIYSIAPNVKITYLGRHNHEHISSTALRQK